MKTIKFVVCLFYKYYSTGPTKDIPFVTTMCALVMIMGMHMFQILIITKNMYIIPTERYRSREENYFIIALYSAPLFLIAALIILMSDYKKCKYPKDVMKRGYRNLIIYIVFEMALLIFLAEMFRK